MKIRYANCWEDAEIVLRALGTSSRGKYLVICSAGDMVLSLLSKKPLQIVAVDKNPAQIACLDLRRAAFQRLPYERVLEFLGVTHASDRLRTFHQLRDLLSDESARFWDTHQEALRTGIIHAGTTEKYFHRFRKAILPLLMDKHARASLFTSKSDAKQSRISYRIFDSWRWRYITRILFSRLVLKNLDLGRAPSFYDDIHNDISAYVRRNVQRVLTQVPTHDNPYLEYIIRGNFVHTRPHYLQKRHFTAIRRLLDTISLSINDITQYLENTSTAFNGFYFSDIFEYMTDEGCRHVLALSVRHSRPKARIVYWSNLHTRPLRKIGDPHIRPQDDTARDLFQQNRAFFYSGLTIGEVA
jgi:S-adenosylmethionine-diacylglycerol 3-amino-3-carboxypropyl transferase